VRVIALRHHRFARGYGDAMTPGGHRHGPSRDADRTALSLALALIVVFMGAEVIAGILSRSMALLSDAAHMLTDAAAIAMALFAARWAARPASGRMTYGWRRVEILAAQANGLTLLLLALFLGYQSVRRLFTPADVAGQVVLITAVAGIGVNLLAVWLVSRADRRSLNVEGAFQHVLTDLFAFIATAVAGAVVLATGWSWADPVAALIVVGLMIRSGVGLLRESGRIFLEAAPLSLDPLAIRTHLVEREAVAQVHDLHVWEITSGEPALSAQVLVEPGADCHAVRLDLESVLTSIYGITHSTLQVDHVDEHAPGAPPHPHH
jgi:cobalt-zinc-cadmium efflux system protein